MRYISLTRKSEYIANEMNASLECSICLGK